MENKNTVAQPPAYEPPAVVYEATIEVRAGTPLGMPDPLKLVEGE